MHDNPASGAGSSPFSSLSYSQQARILWSKMHGYVQPAGLRWTLLQIGLLWLLCVAIILGLFHSLNLPAADFKVIAWQPAHQLRAEGTLDKHYPYPLWTLLLLLPFTFGTPQSDALLWLLFNLLLVAGSMLVLLRLLRWPNHPLLMVLVTSLVMVYEPTVIELSLGQTVIILVLLQLLICLALQKGRGKTAGILLGASCIKPHVLLLVMIGLLGWALWHRRWQLLGGFGAVLVVLISLAAPFASTPGQIFGGGISEHLQLYLAHGSTLWGLCLTLAPRLWQIPALTSAALLIGLVYLWLPVLRSKDVTAKLLFLIAITCVVNLLVVPYSWSYNQVLLVYPIWYAVERSRQCSRYTCIAWSSIIFSLVFPFEAWIGRTYVVPHRSDVYYVIPVMLFLLILCAIEWQTSHHSHSELQRLAKRHEQLDRSASPDGAGIVCSL
ncbi:MAG: DUF2029 domain-containing protein [Herpetosiphonaceae bacterium]|nr:DUF2029 domain-containing protein [Herpetosiphonaceae bacterium]